MAFGISGGGASNTPTPPRYATGWRFVSAGTRRRVTGLSAYWRFETLVFKGSSPRHRVTSLKDLGNMKSAIWNSNIATGSQRREGVGRSRGTAPLILRLANRWKSAVNVKPWALYPKQIVPVPIKQEDVWVGGFWERKNLLFLHRIRTPDRPVRILSAIAAPQVQCGP